MMCSQPGCATSRREQVGGVMMLGGGFGVVGAMYALTPCDPGGEDPSNCRRLGSVSETDAAAALGVGFSLLAVGAFLYLAKPGHQAPLRAPPSPPVVPPPEPAPSPPIVPLPHGPLAAVSDGKR